MLEQNYEYDLLDPEKLLRKYVGRDITIVRDRQEGGTTRAEEVKARLLAYNNGPVWKIGSEIVTGLRADQFRFPELPENLYSHPTLVWMLENARRGAAPRRGVLPDGRPRLERRLRADHRPRRQVGRPRRVGDAEEPERHELPQREAAADRRRS